MSGPAAEDVPDPAEDAARLDAVRAETRSELGLLHERVNALLAAEAFLTIAYVAAMSDGAPWGRSFAAVGAPHAAGRPGAEADQERRQEREAEGGMDARAVRHGGMPFGPEGDVGHGNSDMRS